MPEEKPTVPEMTAGAVKYVEPEEGIYVTYANNIEIGFTPSDLRMVFGEVIDHREGNTTVEQRAHVTISWFHAKILHHWLGSLVSQHEKALGFINVPSELLQIKNV